MKKYALALAAASLMLPTAILADPPAHAPAWGHHKSKNKKYRQGYRDGRRDEQRITSNTKTWRGKDGKYYCKRDNGTTGLIVGAAVGGVAGHEIAGDGDKLLGTVLGAAGGALIGRELDRDKYRCR